MFSVRYCGTNASVRYRFFSSRFFRLCTASKIFFVLYWCSILVLFQLKILVTFLFSFLYVSVLHISVTQVLVARDRQKKWAVTHICYTSLSGQRHTGKVGRKFAKQIACTDCKFKFLKF